MMLQYLWQGYGELHQPISIRYNYTGQQLVLTNYLLTTNNVKLNYGVSAERIIHVIMSKGHYLWLQIKVYYNEDLSNQLNIYTLCHHIVSSVATFGNENYLLCWVRLIESERSFFVKLKFHNDLSLHLNPFECTGFICVS